MSDTLVITDGNQKSHIVDGDNRKILITGQNLEVALTGRCSEVKIIGDQNYVRSETVDLFHIQGSRNLVEVQVLGSGRIRGEDNNLTWENAPDGIVAPSLSMNGDGNNVSMA